MNEVKRVPQSEVTRVDVPAAYTDQTRKLYGDAMANGVKDIHLTLVGKFQSVESELAKPLLLAGEYINTAEVYANGAVNIFVRDRFGRRTALIRVRPLGVNEEK